MSAARHDVTRVNARIEQEFNVIQGVSAYLDPWQVERLRVVPGVRLFEDRAVTTRASLVGAVTTTVNSLSSSVNSALATSPVTAAASSVVTPIATTIVQRRLSTRSPLRSSPV